MSRRGKVEKRGIIPDTKYDSRLVAQITNKVMKCGKKRKAERIVYTALEIVEKQAKREPIEVLEQAVRNATPILAVRPRRIAGATYQVPVEVRSERGLSLAIRWLINSARAHTGRSMAEKLAAEITDAAQGQGAVIKRREDLRKMAESNRAFAHFRW
jgi:small subunit ribosomal protein S7